MRRLITIALWTLAWMAVARALIAPRPPHASATLPGWFGHDGAPPRRIAGRLLERGVPVTGTVHLRIDVPDPSIWTGLDVEAGPDGAFDFGELRPGAYRVLATSADRASRVFEIDTTAAHADTLSIYTAPCSPYRARVMHDLTPIAGARVEIAGVLLATSGADGVFTLCSSFESVLATIRAPGYRLLWTWLGQLERFDAGVQEIGLVRDESDEVDLLDAVPPSGAIPLSLWVKPPAPPDPAPPPFTISGIITHHGRPLPDAVVDFPQGGGCAADISDAHVVRDEQRHEIRTRADGSFTLDIVVRKPRVMYLEISEASGLRAFRPVELLPEGHVHLTIDVADVGSIAGTVTADRPNRSRLRVIAGLSDREPGLYTAVYLRLADDGRFSIPRLETARWYDLTVEDRDTGRSITRRVYLDAAHPDLSDLDVDLSRPLSEDQAVDERGAAVVGATVTVGDEP